MARGESCREPETSSAGDDSDNDSDDDNDDDDQGAGGEHEAALGDWEAEAGRGALHEAPVWGGDPHLPSAQGNQGD